MLDSTRFQSCMPAGLPPDKGMVDFHRLQGCLFPHTNAHIVPEVSTFSCSGSILPYQSHNPHRIHGSGEGGKAGGSTQGYKKKQYLDNWLVSQISPNLSPAYPDSGSFVPQLSWRVNIEKSKQSPNRSSTL